MRVSDSSSPRKHGAPRAGIDLQLTDVRGRGRLLAALGAAQDRSDARDHLVAAEGLDDVVVRAQAEADDLVGLGAARGQDQDRHVRAPLELTAYVETVAVGKVQVQQDEVGLQTLRRLERVACRAATVGSKPARTSAPEKGSEIDASSSTNRMRGRAESLFAELMQTIVERGPVARHPGFTESLYGVCRPFGAVPATIDRVSQSRDERSSHAMSELRTKIAAGVTILALGGLGGVALSHPQAPLPATQVQSREQAPGKQAPITGDASARSDGFERGGG